ncbi:hypothetical protein CHINAEXTREME_14710 [Halobiforma lacisalsi AJ5]|uniref:Uncharacterized protein n=2 Tax=Natronobacterium lacisalsi TaxID=229731 RepID=M0L120_NATLA|nr:hypothetical protein CHINAEXTREME_14710 [Halobiforma lacisalsi AJ5]EMA27257.1 hypothetical protein C445_20725 [Halobiforma lacisalsi AJ5]
MRFGRIIDRSPLEVVPMTDTASASEAGLFETRFSIGSAAAGGLLILVGLVLGWTGYQGNQLPVVGTEMDVVMGISGLMMTWFFGVVFLYAALYMEPGFDR